MTTTAHHATTESGGVQCFCPETADHEAREAQPVEELVGVLSDQYVGVTVDGRIAYVPISEDDDTLRAHLTDLLSDADQDSPLVVRLQQVLGGAA